jgi:subtilisin family serine protease
MKFPGIQIFILILLISFCDSAFSQSGHLIIKLKNTAPNEIINEFRTNRVKSGNSSISTLSRDADVKSSAEVFKKSNAKFANNESYKKAGLDRIFIVELNENNIAKFLSTASKNEFIEYIESNNVLKLDEVSERNFTPNDSYYSEQYYLNLIGLPNVWDITQGDSNIVIGVIDTGLDFLHPDLQKVLKSITANTVMVKNQTELTMIITGSLMTGEDGILLTSR